MLTPMHLLKKSYTSVNALSILKHTHTRTHIHMIRLGNCHLTVLMVHNSHSSKYTVPIQAMGGRQLSDSSV